MIINIKGLIFVFLTSVLLSSCSQNNRDIDLDLSNLPVIKQKEVVNKDKENQDETVAKNDEFIKDLVLLKDSKQILSKFKYGKKDPFSKRGITENKLFSDLKITGFLNSKSKKYVFVIYQDKQGSISDNSIGGLNTDLLPNGAKVLNIDPISNKLIISFENRDYAFEL